MGLRMNTLGTQEQILNPVVILNAIDMVDNLTWFKIPAKVFLHNKSVFSNNSSLSVGVIRSVEKYVPSLSTDTTSPISVELSNAKRARVSDCFDDSVAMGWVL